MNDINLLNYVTSKRANKTRLYFYFTFFIDTVTQRALSFLIPQNAIHGNQKACMDAGGDRETCHYRGKTGARVMCLQQIDSYAFTGNGFRGRFM